MQHGGAGVVEDVRGSLGVEESVCGSVPLKSQRLVCGAS